MSLDYFSPDYFTARSRFVDAVDKAGGRHDALRLRAPGPRGEPPTIDIGRFGSERPRKVFIHSSGIHGVEGFAGSAIQFQFLATMPGVAHDSAIVLVHILNPYGMAWRRRCNENNVDLNRNFLDAHERYEGMPPGYAKYDGLLNPSGPPHNEMFFVRALWLIARYGMPRLKQAVAPGQYERPKGLFFGGKEIQEGGRAYRDYMASRLSNAQRVVVLDVHTGLGKTGQDTLLVDPRQYERLHGFFGKCIAPLDAQRSVAYPIRGGVHYMLSRVFAQANFDFIGQEFGTRPPLHMLYALREENRWHHCAPGSEADQRAKQALKEAFCPSARAWREAVLKRGEEVLLQALKLVEE